MITTGPPNWSGDFTTILGNGDITIPSDALSVSGSSKSVIKYLRSEGAVDVYNTKLKLEALVGSGAFGVGFRVGQNTGNADGIYVLFDDIGLSTQGVRYDFRYRNAWSNPQPNNSAKPRSYWNTSGVTSIQAVLTTNDTSRQSTITWESNANGYRTIYSVNVPKSYLPAAGGVALYFDSDEGSPTVQKLTLSTATTLRVSLYSCIDTETWEDMFYELTGADRNTVTVTARASGENAACKAAGAKDAASSMIVVIESSGVTSQALANSFIASVESGSPAVAPLAIKSIAIVPGTEGATLAGVTGAPTAISAIGAAGAGAGGGGAGGLSGGAIAGIVVGSVAGGIIALSLVTILLVATVVAAILIARNRSKNAEKEKAGEMRQASEDSVPSGPVDDFSHIGPGRVDDAELEKHVSRNLINIFNPPSGGIDIMNNPSNPASGHLSITARSGPVQ